MDERTQPTGPDYPLGTAAETRTGLIRLCDWSATPLGQIEAWPSVLRIMGDLVLASPVPMALFWGPEAILLYNDAYAGNLGTRHPQALGRPAREIFPDIGDALSTTETLCFGFNCSCTPVRDENGDPAGTLCIIQGPGETSDRDDARDVRKELPLKEAHHRIKNNLQLIVSLINLQANQIEDRRTLALFEETRNRVHSIATVYESIHRSRDQATFDMVAFAKLLASEVIRAYDAAQRLQVRIEGASAGLGLNRAAPFGLLLNELVSNACKHAFPAGRRGEMRIRFEINNQNHILTVADNGIGPPNDLDCSKPSSLGLRLIQMLAQQLGGEVSFAAGNGIQAQVRFPVAESWEEEL